MSDSFTWLPFCHLPAKISIIQFSQLDNGGMILSVSSIQRYNDDASETENKNLMSIIPKDFSGYVAVVKEDCATCRLIAPILSDLRPLRVYSQDNPDFPRGLDDVTDDRELEVSYRLGIEIVPTLIRVQAGVETERLEGWRREDWRRLTARPGLGADLPGFSPGCGSKSLDPGMPEKLAYKYGDTPLQARRVEVAEREDEYEFAYERGWSDGLPIVPPTEERVLRMLGGTSRAADEILGIIPPDRLPCTVEKAAINAVMAGCKPEYLPVVLAAVEAACLDAFCMHGLLATTYFSGPIVIVNGPIVDRIGMNWGTNALGQGNRANSTIGRALQLVIRNVGGGKPGGVDRAALGQPGKVGFCFPEREHDSYWESLAVERGFSADESTVTLFAGGGVYPIADQQSRQPESLTRSMALTLRTVVHSKLAPAADAILVIAPEHMRIFREAEWTKARFREELDKHLRFRGRDILRGADGIAEGMPIEYAEAALTKFRPGGLLIVHTGGSAGLWSAVIGGWPASGIKGSSPVTVAVKS